MSGTDVYVSIGELISSAAGASVLRRATLSKPDDKQTVRCVLTMRHIGARTVIQAETFRSDNKALHENINPTDAGRLIALARGFAQINLLTTAGDCELRRSKSGNCIILGEAKLRTALQRADAPTAEIMGNNRQKNRILRGDEPFLRLLDVSDDNGRIHD